LKET
jgi:hypothetical protein